MKKFTILMSLFCLTIMAGSAFAGDTRPAGLKAQVDVMKTKSPKIFECMLADINQQWGDEKDMVLWDLKQQVDAYWIIQESNFPSEIIVAAAKQWGCELTMVVWEIKNQLESTSELDSLLN